MYICCVFKTWADAKNKKNSGIIKRIYIFLKNIPSFTPENKKKVRQVERVKADR